MEQGASSGDDRATAAEPAVSALRDGIPSAVTLVVCGTHEPCDHDFQGWREFDDSCGGEAVCSKCGIGVMAYALSLDF